MPVEPLKIKKQEDILDYQVMDAEDFDYDEVLSKSGQELTDLISTKAPADATHYHLSMDSCGEPVVFLDYGSPDGVKRTCVIQYWKKKVA